MGATRGGAEETSPARVGPLSHPTISSISTISSSSISNLILPTNNNNNNNTRGHRIITTNRSSSSSSSSSSIRLVYRCKPPVRHLRPL